MNSQNAPLILVADDHAMMRDGIVLMIQTAWPGSLCEVAHDYQGVMNQIDAHGEAYREANSTTLHAGASRFDVIVLDLRMPGMRGVESVQQITQRAQGTPVIVCTALEDPSLVERLISSGIYSTVNKKAGADELLNHVRAALAIQRQSKSLQQGMADHRDGANRQHGSTPMSGSAMLTCRQREILKLLHTGKPSKVIASQLGIGLGTIKSHLHTLYSVMEVSNRSEAIVKSQSWFL